MIIFYNFDKDGGQSEDLSLLFDLLFIWEVSWGGVAINLYWKY